MVLRSTLLPCIYTLLLFCYKEQPEKEKAHLSYPRVLLCPHEHHFMAKTEKKHEISSRSISPKAFLHDQHLRKDQSLEQCLLLLSGYHQNCSIQHREKMLIIKADPCLS